MLPNFIDKIMIIINNAKIYLQKGLLFQERKVRGFIIIIIVYPFKVKIIKY